ncbi:S8 family serine peptidase [Bradyrhizobium tropiciagri]|uniref:S8 family serine peptidase n=1 Tax=Bradyrhizobium tropiciagri TaxID=312253 RepID=UPI001BABC197|nr:S8 family serine peptidase [Bradyrhizobium tropiciagri]MBR0875484.1 S8 family serine peptidase [Bradyrhizobium tropiciagri]
MGAWAQNDASGIVISIVDEGVNYLHADLVGSYDTAIDYDPRDLGADDAMPDTAAQHHGTEVASLIAGNINNSLGAVGAAQGATITGSYMRFGVLYDPSELDELIAHQQNYDVSNNSWAFTASFADDFHSSQFASTAAALQADVANGRDGLGTVMVFAAGNGKIQTASGNVGDDANFHNFTNSRFTITVGAHDQNGTPAVFSNPGTTVLLTAPGLGLVVDDGTAPGSTNTAYFSGTSGAAPLVSSAVALMLAANPELGYRDVQEILAISATSRLDGHSAANGFDGFNGGGLMFDRNGGFGMLNASAAVALARNWSYTSTFANEKQLDFSFAPTGDLDPNHSSLSFTLTPADASLAKFSIGYVDIDLAISDIDLKDLQIDLISPDGTVSELVENLTQVGSKTYLSFTFGSVQFMGENPYGTWTLQFSHATPTDTFTIDQADVHVYGDARTADDTYYYTSSYASLALADASRMHAVDTDGGNDTLNFAAGDQAVVLDLSGATASSFQNTAIVLDGDFENVIGTMYNDVLTGSSAANKLVGDFGDDVISGGAGDDILLGGAGNDTLNGGTGSNTIDGGDGVDTAVYADAWSDYDISFDSASGSYRISHHGSSDVDTVTGVELFKFLGSGSQVDVRLSQSELLTGSAPSIASVVASTAQHGIGVAAQSFSPVATITATDPNLVVGDQLTFSLVNADGSPYSGAFSITQTSATTAEIFSSDASATGIVYVSIHDLAGHTVSQQIDLSQPTPAQAADIAGATQHDFNGDGKSDIVLLGDNGTATRWDDGAPAGAQQIASSSVASSGWHLAGTGDFDGNGKSDILWVNDTTGRVSIWDNGDIAGAHLIAPVGTISGGWHFAGTGDFDGNGKSDILWVNDTTGRVSIWDNGNLAAAHLVAPVGAISDGWHFAGTGDFDGNNKSDILWVNDNTGRVSIWSNGEISGAHLTAPVGAISEGWHFAGTGDFDDNGRSDILWVNSNTGRASIWSNGDIAGANLIAPVGTLSGGWHSAGTGDFDGNGRADILWQNSNTGAVSIWDNGSLAHAHIIAASVSGLHIV